MSKKEISEERKALYYGGMVVSGIGLLLFLSAFLSFMNPASMLMGSSPGSGMVLDPKKAREDLSPWSSMAGGIIKDALDETDLVSEKEKEVIKIRCTACSALNDEDATFCK